MKYWWFAPLAAGMCLAATTVPTRTGSASSDYLRLAESGNVRAQRVLAMLLETAGRTEESIVWLRRAAEQQDCAAQVKLGDYYSTRSGEQAAYWYERAASKSKDAMWKLGRLYENGDGVLMDGERALALYSKAARLGSAAARNSMGNLAMLSRDYAAAVRWYRLSAAQGYGEALLNLAGMYFEGLGVKRDYVQARRYAALAKKRSVPEAGAFLAEIARARGQRAE